MPKTKVEVYDKDQLIYPFIESDHVTFSNGMKVTEMLDQSISMPTVTHEDSSFKVGVGDQDVSSAIVDSSVSEMTIKGKTYQNILPEPSTHVLTNNKEMFKVNEGLDSNVEVVDGVSKSAILKGQTLVNLVSSYAFHGDSLLYESRFYDKPIQSGETLTVFVVNPNISTIKVGLFNSSTGVWTREQAFDVSIIKKVVFTVPSGYISKYVGVVVDNPRDSTGFENGLVVAQGDQSHLEVNTYFEGMASCKMPVLTTTGKNLFDGAVSRGYLTDATGQSNNQLGIHSTNYMKCSPNSIYTISGTLNNLTPRFYFYGSDKNYLGYDVGTNEYKKFTAPLNARYMRFRLFSNEQCDITLFNAIQVEESPSETSYEPYKSNILSTPENVTLRGIGDVKDTLDCLTGEVTERIGEVVFDGSDDEEWQKYQSNDRSFVAFSNVPLPNALGIKYTNAQMIVDDFKVVSSLEGTPDGCYISNTSKFNLSVSTSKATTIDELKSYLSQNPITIQYQLATPVIKTVDLSSSGNWEKIVFNGSENWSVYPRSSSVNFVNTIAFQTNTIPNAISTENHQLFSESFRATSHYGSDVEGIFMKGTMRLSIKKSKLMSQDVDGLKQYLQQNPLTVWYQTVVHQDSTQVKQPIFFKDGHIQLSSGADNSLIPTLDYKAKTSNSYVMDLMKNNTRYTMKAKSASGTFTIDDTSYGVGTNGTFTTPSSMTNKLLVMSNKTNEEVMILEGDVVSKTIPYFKGIKSAFEGEDKIEVLSTGKNLFDGELELATIGTGAGEKRPSSNHICSANFIKVKPSSAVILTNNNGYTGVIHEYDKNYNYIKYTSSSTEITKTTLTADTEYVLFRTTDASNATDLSTKFLLEVANSKTTYEPYKSNSTKIPLLSPLRSLPNGVCDELIIDRENNKAKIVQRVGVGVLDGTQNINMVDSSVDTSLYQPFYCGNVFGNMAIVSRNVVVVRCDKLLANSQTPPYRELTFNAIYQYNHSSARLAGQITKKDLGVKSVRDWFRANPTTIYYQLATPVITEVDLEGFPYIYKDGHIFLNSEIAPTTQIIYSINQCQQISASNEDIIRHEKELTYLQKLIAQYVQVNYESALLSLKV